MGKRKIEMKQILPYTEAVAYMEDLLQSFKAGKIVVASGDESIAMEPAEMTTISIEAKAKKGKNSISFEVSWADEAAGDFSISDKEPAPVPAKSETATPATREPAKTPSKTDDAPQAKPAKPKKAAKKAPAKGKTKKKGTTKSSK